MISHDIFGELNYQYLWMRDYNISFLGYDYNIKLSIEGTLEDNISETQCNAFIEFENNKNILVKNAELALFNYYKSIVEDYREMLGDEADNCAPIISNIDELSCLIDPEALYISYPINQNRIIGLLFKTTWEIEHGVAVKFSNGKLVEVGFQDIVL